MAPRTRNILIGSALIVAVGLGTGLVAYYSNALPGRAVDSEFAYIPADVSAVAFADVRSIMDSEFRQKLRQVTPTGTEKNRLLEETGIDIERDIDAVVAGFNTNGPSGAVVVLRGRFDQGRIEELALARGAERQPYGGRVMLVGVNHSNDGAAAEMVEDSPAAAVAFLDDNLLALGEASSVRRAIDSAANNNSMEANTELMGLVSRVQGAGNAWIVGRGESVTAQPQMPDQVRSQIEGIDWVSVSANVDRDVRGLVRAEANNDERAQQLRTMVAGALAAAQMFGQQNAGLATALKSVQAGGTGRSIELAFQISPELLDLLAKTAAEHGALPQPN